MTEPLILSLQDTSFTQSLSQQTGYTVEPVIITHFPDGNLHVRVPEDLSGTPVIIVAPIYGPRQADDLLALLFTIDAAHIANADDITVIIPYLAYGKADNADPGESLRLGVISQMLNALAIDHLLLGQVHSPLFSTWIFDTTAPQPTNHTTKYFNVTTDELFIPWIKENIDTHDLIIVSPDSGAQNASHAFARELRCPYLKLSKTHPTLTGAPIVSDDETKFPKKLPHTAFIVDDFTLTGQTLVQTAALLRGYGITSIYAGVAHAPLTSEGKKLITDSPITKLLTANTTDIIGDDKIIVLDAATQFIKCLHVIYELKEYQHVLQTPEN